MPLDGDTEAYQARPEQAHPIERIMLEGEVFYTYGLLFVRRDLADLLRDIERANT